MKRTLPLLVFFLISISLCGQDITGSWNGALEVQGISLRLVLHVENGEDGYTGSLDSPDQGAMGIPLSAIDYEAPDLSFTIDQLGVSYKGKKSPEATIEGTFTQMGQSFPLNLSRGALEAPKRPQEPSEPYPYDYEEVRFPNPVDGIELAGTLTLPPGKEKPPVVVLISGSGPQDRNETVFGHKPFLALADDLTRPDQRALPFGRQSAIA